MSVLGLKSRYTVKFGLILRLRPYFTVYPSSRPNTDTVWGEKTILSVTYISNLNIFHKTPPGQYVPVSFTTAKITKK